MMRVHAPKGAKDILYGSPPYGWKLSRDRSKLVRYPEEQKVITLVRRLYAGGMTMRQVAAELRAKKIYNRRGRPFPLSRVHEIIHADRKPPPEAEG